MCNKPCWTAVWTWWIREHPHFQTKHARRHHGHGCSSYQHVQHDNIYFPWHSQFSLRIKPLLNVQRLDVMRFNPPTRKAPQHRLASANGARTQLETARVNSSGWVTTNVGMLTGSFIPVPPGVSSSKIWSQENVYSALSCVVHRCDFDNNFCNKMANAVETELCGHWHPREQLEIHVFFGFAERSGMVLGRLLNSQTQLLDTTVTWFGVHMSCLSKQKSLPSDILNLATDFLRG